MDDYQTYDLQGAVDNGSHSALGRPAGWKIDNIREARNLLREVFNEEEADSDVDKALRSASLTTELAWSLLEARDATR